jgi:hypothetical protein
VIVSFCQYLLGRFYAPKTRHFLRSVEALEVLQRRRLQDILRSVQKSKRWSALDVDSSYENIKEQIPIADYSSYRALIEEQRQTTAAIVAGDVVRYEPTSGSTEDRKWIPYTSAFLAEINRAAAIWLGDIFERHPAVKTGVHYWSLSWLPQELRALSNADDTELFPRYQRWILQSVMAVSPRVSKVANADAAWWATLVSLVAQVDLTLVSVWSPTFWLKVCDDIEQRWDEIVTSLESGQWGQHESELQRVLGTCPRRSNLRQLKPRSSAFLSQLWPRLTVLSAWDSSSSRTWAAELRERFPKVAFEGKGLWATEGVVTIPVQGHKVLAIESHFFEFLDLGSGTVFPSWQLTAGRDYQPILWTSTGLLRYKLPDRLRLTGFFAQTPCFEFMGRLLSTDLVGEKIDSTWVQELFLQNPQWQALALVAIRLPQPHYVLYVQSEASVSGAHEVEKHLMQLHHYQVARQLGQLGAATVIDNMRPVDFLRQFGKSAIAGQNKIEPLFEVAEI